MRFQYIPYIWLLLASATATSALALYAWRHRSVPGATPFFVLAVAATVWAVANGLEMTGTDLRTKLVWANLQYVVYVTTPVATLAVVLQHVGRGRWLTTRNLALLAVEPLVVVGLTWTDPIHGLMRRDFHLATDGPFPVIGKTYGPLFWVHAAYTYVLLLVVFSLLIRTLRRGSPLHRRQTSVLLAGFGLPVAWNGLYIFGLSPFPRHDVAPAVFSLSALVLAWGLFRHRLFELMPVARARVFESLDYGVIVLDGQGRIVDVNPAAERMLQRTASELTGQSTVDALNDWPALIELCDAAGATEGELVMDLGESRRTYHLLGSPLSDPGGSAVGRLVVLRDVTERRGARLQLLEQQRALAALEERERLGRELHDSLGQVLAYVSVQAQAGLELCREGQEAKAEELLGRLVEVARDAHADVREFILSTKPSISPDAWSFFSVLMQHLRQFTENYGLETTLSLPERPPKRPFTPEAEVQLLRIVQEALSNARRHAEASVVEVIFTFSEGRAVIVIEDDGIGFDSSTGAAPGPTDDRAHFGMEIMRERAEAMGGYLEVRSAAGRGTKVIVQMPLRHLAAEMHVAQVRALLVDDHALFLEGLHNLLVAKGVDVVGTAHDGLEALEKARALRPDVILMDVHMPACDGLEATRRIKAELPDVKIVMLTVADTDENLFDAIKAGASGYLLKSMKADAFFALLADLVREEVALSPGMASRILEEYRRASAAANPVDGASAYLSARQIEVLELVAQGLTYKEVGASLSLTESTIKYHMRQIMEQLQVESRAQAIAWAVRRGLDGRES